ncbi:hypothetical protein J5N97_001360 [Dioscorea zingiberensis]|uniref:Protein Jade-1 n=1 Tax=Dioscorea zingiberensis TaxID=325984 RepID=A0A9D5BUB5_9LILI|nr:hypothetical protein J5N97_001360 [Dioscorea zingiberensis]
MDSSFHGLPPSKRFKLLQSQPPSSDPPTPLCLPAKKRLETPLPFHSSSSCCLPAKKRVWAPLSLSPIKHQDEEPPPTPAAAAASDEEEDDGILCSVCQSTDGEPQNPIVICDGCELMVHASCYGNPLLKSIPDGDWFCLQCEHKNQCTTPSCCLCPVKHGALKPTVDGNWAHIVCALLVPEVFFKDSEGRDGIDCSLVPMKRREMSCYVCGAVSGCAVECSEPKCVLGFHVSCGLEKGLCFEFKEGKDGAAVVAGFCEDHTQLWEKQQLTGKFRIVPRKT